MAAEETVALTFVDTETTGIIDEYPDAEIIEIAVVTWRDGDRTVELDSLIKPRKAVPPDNISRKLRGFDEKLWKNETTWDVHCSNEIHRLLEGKYIAGSNPDFDKRMIAAECFRQGSGRPKWSHRSMDTCSLGFMLWVMGETEGSGLGYLTEYFGIEHKVHTALGDCQAAISVWECFFDRFIFHPRVMREALEQFASTTEIDDPDAHIAQVIAMSQAALKGEQP